MALSTKTAANEQSKNDKACCQVPPCTCDPGERSPISGPISPGCLIEDYDSYKVLEEVYGTKMTELTIFKNRSSATSEHAVLSKRISNLGNPGHNMAMGHILDSFTDDSELKLKPPCVEAASYVIDESSPVQVEIKWSKPENADKFKSLTYNIEMKPQSTHDHWTFVTSVKFPVFRIYHTEDKLLLGKVNLSRQSYDLTYVLQLQVQGEIQDKGMSFTISSNWSKNIILTFRGYPNEHELEEIFSL